MTDHPTAPVQDDDVRWLLELASNDAVFDWQRDRLERIASRLSPTPETGLVEALRALVEESLYHLRLDARAEAYHNKASAVLKDHRKAQTHG